MYLSAKERPAHRVPHALCRGWLFVLLRACFPGDGLLKAASLSAALVARALGRSASPSLFLKVETHQQRESST